jgi:hypothetical protein
VQALGDGGAKSAFANVFSFMTTSNADVAETVAARRFGASLATNPVHEELRATFTNATMSVDAVIYDLLGREVMQVRSPEGADGMNISVRTLPVGTYLLELRSGNEVVRLRFIRE